MSKILTIYSHNAYKRFLLPEISNADYSILLSERLFDIQKNIELLLEVSDDKWCFVPSPDYEIRHLASDEDCYHTEIQYGSASEEGAYKLLVNNKHIISIIASIADNYFSPYETYDISEMFEAINIGRNPDNAIIYDFEDKLLLSGNHAKLYRAGDEWFLSDNKSANGTYLNSSRIKSDVALKFGDCIDVFGLRIAFFGDKIAINILESGAVVDESKLKKVTIEPDEVEGENKQSLTTLFHRSPRRVANIDTGVVTIDAPPTPRLEGRDRGILSAIGASVGMAFPVLIGCSFMISASIVSGIPRIILMVLGFLIAILSSAYGMYKSLSTVKNARDEYEEYEEKRNQRYAEYLGNIREVLKSKYEKNIEAMHDRYSSASDCCKMDSENPLLWNKNARQPDFLDVRLGIGDVPFQVEIEIPEKKFSMLDNSLMEMPAMIKEEFKTLHDVPVCVNLEKERIIGVVGGRKAEGANQVARDIIAQIASSNSYTDVKLILIYDEKKDGLGRTWDFVRWLPHVWNKTKTFRYIASKKDEASDVFYELNKILRERKENAEHENKAGVLPKPYYVMILANPEMMEGELISKYVTNPDPALGLTTIYLTERYEQLPNECEMIIQNDENYSGVYHVSDDHEQRTAVAFDEADTDMLDNLASNIANVEVQEIETGGDIADSITFFEMYGINKLDELNVLNRWKKNRTYESMKALIGQKAGGEPCFLDIHEKYHGPHGLLAGTTGSGKSETLQTFILSLAINYSPDDVGFFIIDYKGGGMANLFKDLPHMIGQISNLSGNQINRALVSIQSEKDRRETLFREYGVKDIEDYTKLYKNYEATVPLPHLVIVIDEFAELKKENPDFIKELISISRVGRSLGIHLIMATQKPSGNVSEDIWSNSRFKLCLRVESRQDSLDMLRKADAAYINRAGRAYLEVGNDELYEQFQSGYSGAIFYDDESDAGLDTARMLEVTGTSSIEGNHARMARQREKKLQWIKLLMDVILSVCNEKGYDLNNLTKNNGDNLVDLVFKKLKGMNEDYPATDRNKENLITLIETAQLVGTDPEQIVRAEAKIESSKKKLPQRPERTQLEAVVSYLKDLAKENGYDRDFSLFLPMLPKRISLRELPQRVFKWDDNSIFNGYEWPERGENPSIETSIGFYDDPASQRQDVFSINPEKTGNILLFGAASTGKTTLMQTVMYGLVNRYSPAEVNIYALEFSSRKLSMFEDMPNVGGVIRDSDDNDRIDKFFIMLHSILKERKQLSNDQNAADGRSIDDLPKIVILIDNFAALNIKTGDKYHSFIMQLVKEGISNGIYLMVSAQGTGSSEVPNSLAQSFKTTICLELNNPYDYNNYMRMSRLRVYPESGVKGRGIALIDNRALEFQTAIAIDDDDVTVEEQIKKLTKRMNLAWKKDRAISIPEIPSDPTWEIFAENQSVKDMTATDRYLPVGYDCALAVPFGLDLSNAYVYMYTGASGKGKTNALKVSMLSAKKKGSKIVIVDFKDKFEAFAKEVRADRITSEAEWSGFLSTLLVKEVAPRNKAKTELVNSGADEKEIFEAMNKFERICIFIDDLAYFVDKIYNPTVDVAKNVLPNMEMLMEKGYLHNIYWFVTLNRENASEVSKYNLFRLFTKDNKGIHFGGMVHQSAMPLMNFENQDRRTMENVRPAGRGMLPVDLEVDVKEVIMPMVKGTK